MKPKISREYLSGTARRVALSLRRVLVSNVQTIREKVRRLTSGIVAFFSHGFSPPGFTWSKDSFLSVSCRLYSASVLANEIEVTST